MKSKFCFILILIIMLIFASGCVEKKTTSTILDNKTKTNIVYSINKYPEDLLQLNSSSSCDKDILLALFEGLVKQNENGDVVPGIAESVTKGKDNITYTFKLRDNAKWNDGKEITAEDFVTFFKDILNPKLKNNYAIELYSIFGAQDYNNGKKSFSGVAIRAVDEKTLELRLNSPSNSLLQILSEPVFALRIIDTNLKDWKNAYKSINYTGPFSLYSVDNSAGLTLLKNENYYGKDDVKSDKLYITTNVSTENAMASFKNNKINLFLNPPVSEIKNLIINGEEETIPVNIGWSLNFNFKKSGIVNDISFRRALSLAINREKIAENNLNSTARAAFTYVPKEDTASSQVFNASKYIKKENDDTLSKELLTNSKYDKKEKVSFIYLDNDENKRIADAVAKNIKEVLDINLDCKGLSEEGFNDLLVNGNFNIALNEYTSSNNDAVSFLEPWISTSKSNIFGYNNSQYDELIFKAKLEGDKQKRLDYIKNGETILLNEMPNIPLFFQNMILCKKSDIKGIYILKEGNVKLDKAFIDDTDNTNN
ncbi:peptide ABC transporter substrate-binding protein [Candidatus Clostridium radicumherbarum]|uniref:Peptide ABC transporter substrate-binding protein n=1 Tax=Candidatus Clostridium radicumherbarum TaxID=3381662 RepID=A0ABW8TU59_9CLOT